MIVVIDYDVGNVKSVVNMLSHIGHKAVISRDIDTIKNASKLILPGVGAFETAMRNLKHFDLIETLNEKVIEMKTPILGICLGLQIMALTSEEGDGKEQGLGWFDARVKLFDFSDLTNAKKYPVPHMGWNMIDVKKEHKLFSQLLNDNRFYFVHSYYIECNDETDILATAKYGTEFTCAISKNNIVATQFHPEKSLKFGMHVLRNFAENGEMNV